MNWWISVIIFFIYFICHNAGQSNSFVFYCYYMIRLNFNNEHIIKIYCIRNSMTWSWILPTRTNLPTLHSQIFYGNSPWFDFCAFHCLQCLLLLTLNWFSIRLLFYFEFFFCQLNLPTNRLCKHEILQNMMCITKFQIQNNLTIHFLVKEMKLNTTEITVSLLVLESLEKKGKTNHQTKQVRLLLNVLVHKSI